MNIITDRIKEVNGCWEWQGYVQWNGYGKVLYKGKNLSAHRLSYALFDGDIPAGIVVCHRCDNRKCVNPDHLILGPDKDNYEDSVRKGRRAKVDPPRNQSPSKNKRIKKHHPHRLFCRGMLPVWMNQVSA